MSANDEESAVHELVIIRRRGGDEEGAHKGGVWKIAYADFMTAMMAFFLVMWLINATDRQVITQLASYFNPLRLTDKVPSARGPNNPQSGESTQPEAKGKDPRPASAVQKMTEDRLFNDPYIMLDKLAKEAEANALIAPQASVANAQGRQARISGEAFRDPFDPQAKSRLEVVEAAKATPDKPADAVPVDLSKDVGKPVAVEGAEGRSKAAADAAALDSSDSRPKSERMASEQAEVTKLEAEIKQALAQLGPAGVPEIEVKVTEDGLLISLTDKFDFGMFAIASAEPRPAMVLIMEKLARILQARPGQLIVRGHTDGRPFRSATYDNWRLSTARAHMAHYMLVRGGIEEKRFERIEGHADRTLRVANDAGAAQNRRIEILLRAPKP
jgi:chemotaxis protein MotB